MWLLMKLRTYLSRVTVLGTAKPLLVPLTSSLYVPGRLADPDNVLVDVGARYYVEKVGHLILRANSGIALLLLLLLLWRALFSARACLTPGPLHVCPR